MLDSAVAVCGRCEAGTGEVVQMGLGGRDQPLPGPRVMDAGRAALASLV